MLPPTKGKKINFIYFFIFLLVSDPMKSLIRVWIRIKRTCSGYPGELSLADYLRQKTFFSLRNRYSILSIAYILTSQESCALVLLLSVDSNVKCRLKG